MPKMTNKENPEDNFKTNSSVLIFIVSFLLLVSLAVSVFGILNMERTQDEEGKDEEYTVAETVLQEGSLSDLFQEGFSGKTGTGGGNSLNDPFREGCTSATEGGVQVISSYTVCTP